MEIIKPCHSRDNALTLSVRETARELGISVYLTRKLVQSGQIPSIRFGRLVRVPRAKLMEMVIGNKLIE